MNSRDLEKILVERKGYDELRAKRAVYQSKIFLRSLCYSLLILGILYCFNCLFQGVLVIIFYKIYRSYAGGIHIKNYMICFISSFFIVFVTILLVLYVPLNIYSEILMWILCLTIWYLYVPQGTAARPFRKVEEKMMMKKKMIFIMILLAISRFFIYEIYIYGFYSLIISLLLITPPIYKILHLKNDRN